MKIIEMSVIVALLAVVVALFAWAMAKVKNALRATGRQRSGTIISKWRMLMLLLGVWLGNLLLRLRLRPLPESRSPLPQFCNVGSGSHEHGKISMVSDTATTLRYLFYEQSGTSNECTPALGTNEPLGLSDDLADTNALDVPIAIKLLGGCVGTTRAISDGSVTNNTRICVAKDGTSRAICPAAAAGTFWVVGKAIVPSDNDAGGPVVAGDDFEFIPCFPFQKTY
jgi:hypothetical protein